jgi:Ca-activated chloride channel family protein
MKTLGPIVLFAVLALGATLGLLAGFVGGGLRHVVWAQPRWLLAAVIPVAALVIRQWWSPRPATMRFSRARSLGRMSRSWATRLVALPDGLRLASALLLVGALARPQSTHGADRIRHEGIDIVIALDLSESMKSADIPPSRLRAAQMVIDDFIQRRPHDRIGLVVFGSKASTVSPLTMDHGVLRKMVLRLRLGVMDGRQTAIGAGLGLALNRLSDSTASSKIVVLLTDGVHNADGLDPDGAAEEAAKQSVRVYTVLMGQGLMGGEPIDAAQLERIASITGGYAYTAVDAEALIGSFQNLLDELEKSTIEGQQVRPELFQLLLWPALGLLLLDVLLRSTRLRRFP